MTHTKHDDENFLTKFTGGKMYAISDTIFTSFLLAVCLGNVSVHFLDLHLITSFVSHYLHIFDAIGT
jgi:hypothetical protein